MPPSKKKNKQAYVPVEKDDGTRWRVVDSAGVPVYLIDNPEGLPKREAKRLAEGLVEPATIEQVNG